VTEGGFAFPVPWCGDSGLDEGDAQTLLRRLLRDERFALCDVMRVQGWRCGGLWARPAGR
jgi:hypothetical protein